MSISQQLEDIAKCLDAVAKLLEDELIDRNNAAKVIRNISASIK